MTKEIVIGIIEKDSSLLVCQRPNNKQMARYWEFPGGKKEKNETSLAALKRELDEELGIEVIEADFLIHHYYEYSHNFVLLEVWQVKSYKGSAYGREQQAIKWCPYSQLFELKFLPANLPLIHFIKHYLAL